MKKQKGFGLLEILITLVLLGVGVAGMVALARNMLASAQEGRRYEVAMRLAESRLDEFRNFNGVVSAAAGTLYKDIVSGSRPSLQVSDGSYDLSWKVSEEYLNSGSWSTTNLASAPYPDRKLVEVTVQWSDNSGKVRDLKLSGAISPTTSFTKEEEKGLLTARANPKVEYTKGKVPDVVAVELGDNSYYKETSKPLPHIQGGSSTSRTVQFDTATYQTLDGVSTSQAKQDTATVYCSCSFAGAKSDATNPAYLPSHPYYDQTAKVQYWKSGDQLDKSIGALKGNANTQEALCPVCCREHYDVSSRGFAGYYDPLNLQRTSNRTPGDYEDACRFIRINGFYRPAPDWNLASFTTFSASFLDIPANLKKYQDYIAYVVKTHAKWQFEAFGQNGVDTEWSKPDSNSLQILSFNAWLATSGNTNLQTETGTTQQLISRGVYVDIMPPSYLRDSVFKGGATEPDLAKVPFQDVNLTLLSDWIVSQPSKGSVVTSEGIDTQKTYSRGVLTSGNSLGNDTVVATTHQGNWGLVGVNSGAAVSSAVTINISAQAPKTEYLVDIYCFDLKTTGSSKDPTYSAVSCDSAEPDNIVASDAAVKCTVASTTKNPSTAIYRCAGAPGSIFKLTVTKNNYSIYPLPQTEPLLELPAVGNPQATRQCVKMLHKDLVTALGSNLGPTCPVP